jgi:hypothetical protein
MLTAAWFARAKEWESLNVHQLRNGKRECGMYIHNAILLSCGKVRSTDTVAWA